MNNDISPIQQKMLEFLKGNPATTSSILAKNLNISRVAVYENLFKLMEINKIYKEGNGRATKYSAIEQKQILENLCFGITQIFMESLEKIQRLLEEKYNEIVDLQDLEKLFFEWFRYVNASGFYFDGWRGFILWCDDERHKCLDKVEEKAIEYLDIIGSLEHRRHKKIGFFDGTSSAKQNLNKIMDIGFDAFFFCAPSVIENGFGRTKTALSLYFGKKNSNKELLMEAIQPYIDDIKSFLKNFDVDAFLIAPPSEGRKMQFRDVLHKQIPSSLTYIHSFKKTDDKRVIESQKSIKDRMRRVQNAENSMEIVEIPNLHDHKHIVIFDDSFTTGATPNALALILRKQGFVGRITIITICGNFNYELSISEDEI